MATAFVCCSLLHEKAAATPEQILRVLPQKAAKAKKITFERIPVQETKKELKRFAMFRSLGYRRRGFIRTAKFRQNRKNDLIKIFGLGWGGGQKRAYPPPSRVEAHKQVHN